MNEQNDVELERSTMRIRDAIAPYTRFVRGELEKLEAIDTETSAILSEIRTLRHKIGAEDRATAVVTVRRPVDAPLPTPALAPRSHSTPVREPIETIAETPPVAPTAGDDPVEPVGETPQPKTSALSADDV